MNSLILYYVKVRHKSFLSFCDTHNSRKTFILIPKDAVTAEINKTDCAHDCDERTISVSLEAQALA